MPHLGFTSRRPSPIRPDELERVPGRCRHCGGRLYDAGEGEIKCVMCGWVGYIVDGRVMAPRRER